MRKRVTGSVKSSGRSALVFTLVAGSALGSLLWLGLPRQARATPPLPPAGSLAGIDYIFIIHKENRSFHHMFGQYPGVAGESANCTHSNGEIIPCYHMPDLDHWDTNHDYTSQTSAIDSGLMDRFDIKAGTPGGPVESLSQYTRGDLPIYYALIDNYAVDDGFFPLFSESYPNHLATLAAQTGPSGIHQIIDNTQHNINDSWGFDAGVNAIGLCLSNGLIVDCVSGLANVTGSDTDVKEWVSAVNDVIPPFHGTVTAAQVWGASVGVQGYTWLAANGIESLCGLNAQSDSPCPMNGGGGGAWYQGTSSGNLQPLITAIQNEDGTHSQLGEIIQITPSAHSEHPIEPIAAGEDWTRQVIQAIWNNPNIGNNYVIFLDWDDYGGFYDPVTPPSFPDYGLGVRVPLLMISPYVRTSSGPVTNHVYHPSDGNTNWGSEIAFIRAWATAKGTPINGGNPIGVLDNGANDLTEAFDFTQVPITPPTLTPRTISAAVQQPVTVGSNYYNVFSSTPVGSTSGGYAVTVTNQSSFSVTFGATTLDGDATTLSDTCQSQTISAGGTCAISAAFAPSAPGNVRTGLIHLNYSCAGCPEVHSPVNFGVIGNATGGGGAPVAGLSPSSLTFAGQLVNTTSAPQIVTLSNTGNATLSLTSITLTGANAGDFAESNNCGSSVAAGASCTLTVTFTPTAQGTRTAAISIVDNAAGSPQTVPLSGTGTVVLLSLSPASLTFSGQPVSTTSAPQIVTLSNTGSATLSVTSITLTGANAGDFAESNNCGSSVAAGASCTLTVTFTPTAEGTRTAAISIADNAAGSPQTVPLSGTGTVVLLSLSPSSLTFAGQLVSTTSAPQIVTLSNTGNATLSLTSITLTGANAGDFAESNNCGSSVAAGASCTLTVTFTPTAEGTRTAAISIADNAAGSPQTVPLSGTGTVVLLSLSPSSLTFAGQLVSTTSAPQIVTLSNTGSATLSVTSITLTGANAGDFAESNNCGSSVAAGANCTLTVTFTPTAEGTRTAAISIADNAAGSPQTVPLSGTGTVVLLSLSPSSLTFAGQPVNTTSAPQIVTLTNTGSATLSVTSITLTGANAGDFAESNNCGSSVAAGASCALTVTFTPAAEGTRAAAISIADNAAGSPQAVPLSGTGTVVLLSLSPASLTFAGQPLNSTSAPQTVTLSNTGNAALSLTSISITGANAGDFAETNATTCGSSLAAGANCVIVITFTPTAGGTRTAAISIADNAAGSPQAVSLAGTGEDFTLGPASGSSTSATITRGQTASYSLSVASVGGLSGTISLTCAGAPSEATCALSPGSVTISGSSASNVAVSVATTAPGIAVPRRRLPPSLPPFRIPVGWLALAAGLASAALVLRRRPGRTVLARQGLFAALLFALFATVWMPACGGSGSSGPVTNPGTPPGTYTLTVTATFTSGSTTLAHNQTLTLTVQ